MKTRSGKGRTGVVIVLIILSLVTCFVTCVCVGAVNDLLKGASENAGAALGGALGAVIFIPFGLIGALATLILCGSGLPCSTTLIKEFSEGKRLFGIITTVILSLILLVTVAAVIFLFTGLPGGSEATASLVLH